MHRLGLGLAGDHPGAGRQEGGLMTECHYGPAVAGLGLTWDVKTVECCRGVLFYQSVYCRGGARGL